MKKLLLLCAFLSLAILEINAQAFQWAKTQGDVQSYHGIKIASDGSNLISAGTFVLPITFGNQTFTSNGKDGYLVKHNPSGNPLWAKHLIGIKSLDQVETDLNQNVIITGTYQDSLFIGNLIFKESGAPQLRTFIAKFNSNGTLLWTQKLPSTNNYPNFSLTTDGLGNIYYVSTYSATVTIGTTTLTPPTANIPDLFIVKYNPAGSMQWVKITGGVNRKYIFSIIGSNNDGVILGCYCDSPTGEIFLRKYNGIGNQVWNKSLLNNDISAYFSMSLDKADNIYLIGANDFGWAKVVTLNFDNLSLNLNGTYNGAAYTNNIFLAKLSSSGTWKWAKNMGTGNYAADYFKSVPKIDKSLYFTGSLHGNISFGSTNLATQFGHSDCFHIKVDTAGNPLRAFKMESSTSQFSVDELAIDNQENNFLAGSFYGTTTLGNTTLINNAAYPIPGGPTPVLGFLAKLAGNPNTISGTLFIDANGNGVKDTGELPFENGMVEITPGPGYSASAGNGEYSAILPMGTYNLQVLQPSNHYTFIPQNQSVTFSGLGQTQTKDFALVPIPNRNDVKITVTNLTPARPGFALKYRITYQNVGTTTLSDSITLKYTSGNLTYTTTSITPASQQPGKIRWFYQPLQPNEKRNIDVEFAVPASTPINTKLNAVALIKPLATDFIPGNNYDTLNHVVTGSYDPNDKQVSFTRLTPSQVAQGKLLDYTIRFQNTGTDTAFTVIVRDSISDKLHMPSFELLSASHPYTFRLLNNGMGEWRFDNIKLPDSTRNEQGSHGFIRYRMQPKNNLVLGDEIKSRAAIYFDYNAPVMTNNAITKVSNITGIKEEKTGIQAFKLYPNPARNYVMVEANFKANTTSAVSLVNLLGQTISKVKLPANDQIHYQLPLNDLPKGVYLIRLETETGIQTQRLVIQ